MTAREDDMRDVARGDAKLPAPFPASVAAEEALSEPVALAGVGDAVWPLSSKEEADLRERWRQHVGHNAIRPDDTVARLLATLDAARSRPAGELDAERLLDAVRAYGDARADVAYGRATRKAIDRAWDQMLAVASIPPMDARLASSTTTEAGALEELRAAVNADPERRARVDAEKDAIRRRRERSDA